MKYNSSIAVGVDGFTESEVIAKYEIMDGLPVRGKNWRMF